MALLMFLGGIVASAPILALFFWIGTIKGSSKWRLLLVLYWTMIFLVSYSIEPHATNDITRYWTQLENCGRMSFSQVVDYLNDGLIVENILFWFFGKLGDVRLLPALSASCVYTIAAYIAGDASRRIGAQKYLVYGLILQLSMLPFFSIVNNLRNVSAFSIIVFAAYRDFVEKKKNLITLALYIMPVFMHKTGVVLLIARLLVPLFKRVFSLSVVLILFLSSLIGMTYNNLNRLPIGGTLGLILNRLIRSAYRYMTVDTEYSIKVRNSLAQTTLRYLVMGATVLMLIMVYYYIRKNVLYKEFENLGIFCFFCGIITLSCNIFDIPAYWRFSCASIILFTPILIVLLKLKSEYMVNRWIVYGMMLFGSLCLARFAVNIVGYEYRRIEPDIFLTNVLTTNMAGIIGKLIFNFLSI